MPIYEYRCEKCGDFEHTQRITDIPLQRCPTCKRKVRRLISNTSFQLKGSGWYVTDYARAGKDSKDGKKDAESAPSSSAPDGAKSDAGGSDATKSDSSKSEAAPAKPAKSESKSDSKKRARASA
jgi:putative FmdB family regulatory protein